MKAFVLLTCLFVIAGVLHWVLRGLWKAASCSAALAVALFILLAHPNPHPATLAILALLWVAATAIFIIPGLLLRRGWPNHFREYDLKTQGSRYFGLRSRIAGAVVVLISIGGLGVFVAKGPALDDWKMLAGGILGIVVGGYYLVTGKRAATASQFILEGKLAIEDPAAFQTPKASRDDARPSP